MQKICGPPACRAEIGLSRALGPDVCQVRITDDDGGFTAAVEAVAERLYRRRASASWLRPTAMGLPSESLRALAAADRAAAAQEKLPNAKRVLLQSAVRWDEMADRAEMHERISPRKS